MRHSSLWPAVRGTVLAFSALAGVAGYSFADQIVLNNGDRLTGTINSAEDGKITITCPIEGKVVTDLSNVKTFSTDEPIKIVLNDGTVIDQVVNEGDAGTVKTAAQGSLAVQAIPLANVAKINPVAVAWTGTIAISGAWSQGNSNSESLGATLNLMRRTDTDRFLLGAQYLFGKQKVNGISTTATDQWYITPEYDYFFTKKVYMTANIRVEKNRIQNLDLRVTPALGVGYQFVERPDFNANVEGGLAWVYEDYTTLPNPNENFSLRLAYHIDKTFWKTLKLFSDCAYFPSLENASKYLILFKAGGRLAMTQQMFSELRCEVDYDSQPAPGSKRTDSQVILAVGWTF
jgi:putative salt-induced outer membrane protein YdiY